MGSLKERYGHVAGAIPPLQEKPLQTHNSLEDILEHSHAVRPALLELGSVLARHYGGVFVLAENKHAAAAAFKVATKYNGHAAMLTDVARGTIWVDSVEKIVSLQQTLPQLSQTRHIKDEFAQPTKQGYRGIKATMDINGVLVEMRVEHKGMRAAYEQTHKLHEQIRAGTGYGQYETKLSEAEAIARCRAIHDDAARACGLDALEIRPQTNATPAHTPDHAQAQAKPHRAEPALGIVANPFKLRFA